MTSLTLTDQALRRHPGRRPRRRRRSAATDGAVLAAGHGLPRKAVAHLQAVLAALEATGKPDEVHRVVAVPGVKATSVVLTGLGDGSTGRAAYAPASLRARPARPCAASPARPRSAVALPTPDRRAWAPSPTARWSGATSTTGPRSRRTAGEAHAHEAVGRRPDDHRRVRAPGRARRSRPPSRGPRSSAAARDFDPRPGQHPRRTCSSRRRFADAGRPRARGLRGQGDLTVLDEKALAKGGFGGIVGVGQGSVHPPRIVTMTYRPAGATGHRRARRQGHHLRLRRPAIKPPAGMVTMKSDMAGAAAVAAAVIAAAELGLPVAVTGYLCLAENMPSGTAQRPGDVVAMRDGTTVEILNTDAEGRMVLADGICLASEEAPDAIVDIATLTGAQMVALGSEIAGVMANDDAFRARSSRRPTPRGERAWPMPLPEELRAKLDSPVADIAHKGDREGGMLAPGSSSRSSSARASRGPTSTSPGRRSTSRPRAAGPPRAARASASRPCSRWSRATAPRR